jgi:hypothetical protein
MAAALSQKDLVGMYFELEAHVVDNGSPDSRAHDGHTGNETVATDGNSSEPTAPPTEQEVLLFLAQHQALAISSPSTNTTSGQSSPGSKKRSSNEDGEMAVNRHAKRRQEKKQKDAAMEAQLASKTAEADSLRDLLGTTVKALNNILKPLKNQKAIYKSNQALLLTTAAAAVEPCMVNNE